MPAECEVDRLAVRGEEGIEWLPFRIVEVDENRRRTAIKRGLGDVAIAIRSDDAEVKFLSVSAPPFDRHQLSE